MSASKDEKEAVVRVLKDWEADVDVLFTAIESDISDIAVEDDTDFLALSQSPGGAGNLTLEAVQPAVPRRVTITSPDDNSLVNFTVTGTDNDDAALVEGPFAGPDGETLETNGYFKTVTQIAVDAAGTNVEAGIGEILASAIYDVFTSSKSFKGSVPAVTLDNALTSLKNDV